MTLEGLHQIYLTKGTSTKIYVCCEKHEELIVNSLGSKNDTPTISRVFYISNGLHTLFKNI
jgi:hypothetical protein